MNFVGLAQELLNKRAVQIVLIVILVFFIGCFGTCMLVSCPVKPITDTSFVSNRAVLEQIYLPDLPKVIPEFYFADSENVVYTNADIEKYWYTPSQEEKKDASDKALKEIEDILEQAE